MKLVNVLFNRFLACTIVLTFALPSEDHHKEEQDEQAKTRGYEVEEALGRWIDVRSVDVQLDVHVNGRRVVAAAKPRGARVEHFGQYFAGRQVA